MMINDQKGNFDTQASLEETELTKNIVDNILPYDSSEISNLPPIDIGNISIGDMIGLDFSEDFNFPNNLKEETFPEEKGINPFLMEPETNGETVLMDAPTNTSIQGFSETVNTLNGVGLNLLLNQIVCGNKQEDSKKYNKVKEHNEKRIMEIMSVHNLPYESINGILKMNEAFIENLNFYLSLRKVIDAFPTKSKVMDLLGIRKSYTGFHDFIKGERPDLPEVGVNAIAKKLGYSIALVPVPLKNNDTEDSEKQQEVISLLQNNFVKDVEKLLEDNLQDDKDKKKPKEKVAPVEEKNIMDFMKSENAILDMVNSMDHSLELVFEEDEVLDESLDGSLPFSLEKDISFDLDMEEGQNYQFNESDFDFGLDTGSGEGVNNAVGKDEEYEEYDDSIDHSKFIHLKDDQDKQDSQDSQDSQVK